MKLPEDLRRSAGGENIDRTSRDAIRLAHDALDRFPDLVRRHKFIAGGAAISSALVALAGVAVARRMHHGQTADDAVADVTSEELEGLRVVTVSDETDELEVVDPTSSNGTRRPTDGAAPVDTPAAEDATETTAAPAAEAPATEDSDSQAQPTG